MVGVAPDVDGASGRAIHRDLPGAGVGAIVRADAGFDLYTNTGLVRLDL